MCNCGNKNLNNFVSVIPNGITITPAPSLSSDDIKRLHEIRTDRNNYAKKQIGNKSFKK